jgi:hypothetical protein
VVHISGRGGGSYRCLYTIYADNQIKEKSKMSYKLQHQNLHIETEAMERCRRNIQTVITETDGKSKWNKYLM